ncbi:hypothetical protein CLOM_g18337 [Closterium sp. NIES-68]|nr:hypothetical protein CLOM_g18337 [Closterium sp. NIES-68]
MVAAGQAVQHTPRPTEVAPAGLRTEHPAFDGAACVQQLRDTAPCDMAPCDMAPCDTAARDMAPCGMVAVVQCHVVFDAVFSVPQLLLLPCHPDGRPLLSQDLFAFLPPLPDHPLLPSPPPSTVVRHPHPPAASPTSSLPPRTCDPLGPTIDSWRLLTPVEHPFLGRPCLAVHPCNTASTMALMLHAAAHAAAAGSGGGAAAAACGADNKAATWPTAGAAPAAASTGASHDHSQGLELYMLSWLSLVGRIVGMHIPPSLLDRMASLSSAKIP